MHDRADEPGTLIGRKGPNRADGPADEDESLTRCSFALRQEVRPARAQRSRSSATV
jgi:hypothetical protein